MTQKAAEFNFCGRQVLTQEVRASRQLEEILYSSRSPRRKRYTVLHRPLVLK